MADGADLEQARLAEINAQSGLLWSDVNVDDSRLVTTSFDEPVPIWDISGLFDGVEPRLISEIEPFPRGGPPTIVFSSTGEELISVGMGSQLVRFMVDNDDVVELALSRLSRSLTSEECATYGIEDCRGLDELAAITSDGSG